MSYEASRLTVDREFKAGTRYLFVPYEMQDGFASDHSCSATQPWRGP